MNAQLIEALLTTYKKRQILEYKKVNDKLMQSSSILFPYIPSHDPTAETTSNTILGSSKAGREAIGPGEAMRAGDRTTLGDDYNRPLQTPASLASAIFP